MRDAYILDLATGRVGASTTQERLRLAAEAVKRLQSAVFGAEPRLEWLGVATSDGALGRSLGLVAGLSAGVCGQDVSAGSGLAALAAAARAVTSGFESVAGAVAFGPTATEPAWPESLQERFTRVSSDRAHELALRRAQLDASEVLEQIEARRIAFEERGGTPVALSSRATLPVAPDEAGLGAVLLAGHTEIREHGWRTRARITSVVQTGLDPALGPAAAAQAAQTALHRLHLRPEELDFLQVDGRLSATPTIVGKTLGIAADRINPHGGALCLGGAGAASGLVDLQLLLDALEAEDRRFGLVVGLEPMGGATAIVIDRQFYM